MKYLNHFNKHWGRGRKIYMQMRALEQDSFFLFKKETQRQSDWVFSSKNAILTNLL